MLSVPLGVVTIDPPTTEGEIGWHCAMPHGAAGVKLGNSRFDGRLAVDATVCRHLAASHPELDVDAELADAWSRAWPLWDSPGGAQPQAWV